MVLVHNPWSTPGTNLRTIDNSRLYVSYNWGDGTQNWTFVEMSPASDQLSGTISFSDILKTLVWDGVLTGSEYISGIELGAEVGGGTGSLAINNLSYQWVANSTVEGTAGNDTFNVAAVGGNYIVGNGGIDTVIYNGVYSQFQIKASGPEFLVMENNNISTLDVLSGVTYIDFTNGKYNTTTSTFTPSGPTVASVAESPASGDLGAGKTVTLTLTMSEAVTVAGGAPTLTLNDGGTATYSTGSGTNVLTFNYTVAAEPEYIRSHGHRRQPQLGDPYRWP